MSKKEQVRVKKASLHYYRYKKNWSSEQKKSFREIAEELIKAEILSAAFKSFKVFILDKAN